MLKRDFNRLRATSERAMEIRFRAFTSNFNNKFGNGELSVDEFWKITRDQYCPRNSYENIFFIIIRIFKMRFSRLKQSIKIYTHPLDTRSYSSF